MPIRTTHLMIKPAALISSTPRSFPCAGHVGARRYARAGKHFYISLICVNFAPGMVTPDEIRW